MSREVRSDDTPNLNHFVILCDPGTEILDGILTGNIPSLKVKGEDDDDEIGFLFVMKEKGKK